MEPIEGMKTLMTIDNQDFVNRAFFQNVKFHLIKSCIRHPDGFIKDLSVVSDKLDTIILLDINEQAASINKGKF